MSNLKMRYIDFLEDQRVRDERNHRIIEALNKVDNSLANMTAKTNRLAILRKQYEMHLLRSYSTRTNEEKGSRAGSKASRRNASNIQTNKPTPTVNSFAAQPTSNFTPTNQRYVKQESEVHSKSCTPNYLRQSRPVPRDSQRAEQSASDPRSSMGLHPFGARNPELSASTFLENFYTGLNSVQSHDYLRPSVMGLDDRSIRPTWLDSTSEQSFNSCGNYLEAPTRANYTRKPLERIATNDKLVGSERYHQTSPKLVPRLDESGDMTPDDFTAIELDRCIDRIRGLFSKKIHNKDATNILAPNSSAFLSDELMIHHTDPTTHKLGNYSYSKSTEPSSVASANATGLANLKLHHHNSTISSIPSSSVYTNEIYHDIAGDQVHLVHEDPVLDRDVDSATGYNENNAKEIIRSGRPTEQKTSAEHNDLEDEKTEVKAVGSPVRSSDKSISILRQLSSEKSVDSSRMKLSDQRDMNLVRRQPEKDLSREIRNDHRDGDSERELLSMVDSRRSGHHGPESSYDEQSEGVQKHLDDAESSMRQNVTTVREELAGKTNEHSLDKTSDLVSNKQYETSEHRQMSGKKTDEPSVNDEIHDYQKDQRYKIDATHSQNLDSDGQRELNTHGKYIEHSNNEHQTRRDGQSNENEEKQPDGTLKELAEGEPYAEYVTDPNQQYEAHSNEQYEAHPNEQYETRPNEQYKTLPNEQYEARPNEQYEAHPNEQYEADPNAQYEAHPNEIYQTDPNEQYESHPNEQYEAHPNEQYETQPNEQYKTLPNEQYEAHPNEQYEALPNEQYEAHPNEEYEAHPNEQYEAHPNEQYEAHPNEQYQVNPNEQYEASPNQEYEVNPNEQYAAHPNEQYEAYPDEQYPVNPNEQYKANPNQEYEVNPNREYEVNPNEQYETYPNETYEAHPNAQYVANPEELQGSNPNENYVVDPAKQYEFGLNQPYNETANNKYETYPNEQQYYGAHDPQASSQNVVDAGYEYYSNEQYAQDPNNQQYEEDPNASYIQAPHEYQQGEYDQNESYDRRAYEYHDENPAHPEEFNSDYPKYVQQSGFDHGQDVTGQSYATVDDGVVGDNREQVEDHSISESIPNNAMGGTDKKTKDAINALLDSGTESTIERDQSNATENDFDFN